MIEMNTPNLYIDISACEQELIISRLLLYKQKYRMQGKRWLCLGDSFSPTAILSGKSTSDGIFSFKFSVLHGDVSTPIARIKGRVSGTTRDGSIFLIKENMQSPMSCASIKTGASGVNIYDARMRLIGKVKSCFFPAEYKIYKGEATPCCNLRKDKNFLKSHNNFSKKDFQSVFRVSKCTTKILDLNFFLSLLVSDGFMSGNGFMF